MVETADVVVIGGGVNGISIAYALAAQGVPRVALCEKDALASGASCFSGERRVGTNMIRSSPSSSSAVLAIAR